VSKVATANVEGKKKRSRGGFYRRPDFKLAYVKLSAAVKIPAPPPPPPKEDDKAKAKPKA
jgi:ribosomal protein L23